MHYELFSPIDQDIGVTRSQPLPGPLSGARIGFPVPAAVLVS